MGRIFNRLGSGIVGTAIVGAIACALTPVSAKGLSKDAQAIFDHVSPNADF
jgi:hypothetical protein